MADNNKAGTTKDHSNSGIRRFSAKESNQDYGEIGTGHSLKGVSKNGKEGKLIPNAKKQNIHTKTGTQG